MPSITYDEKLGIVLQAIVNGILPGLAALGPLAAALGVGLALLQLGQRRHRHGIELPLALALGLGVLGYLADLIYPLQVFRPRLVLVALMAAGLIALAWSLRHTRGLLAPAPTWEWPGMTRRDRWLAIAGWGVVWLIAVKHYMNTVLPIVDSDSILHYSFLSRLIARDVPFDEMLMLRKMPITDLNRVVQQVYAMGHVVMGEGSMHLMNAAFLGTTVWLLHAFTVHHLRLVPVWSPLPTLLVFNVLEILPTGYSGKVDYGVAMLEVATMLCVVLRQEAPRWLLPTLLGLCLCARVNSMRLAVIVGAVVWADTLWQAVQDQGLARGPALWAAARRSIGILAGAAALAWPPYLVNALIYGNPVFPFFNGVLGAYPHFYDLLVLEHQRYYTQGVLGPLQVFVQLCTIRFWEFLDHGNSLGGRYGLGPVFLLVPLAFARQRSFALLSALVSLGFLLWWTAAHTHRTLLGVAFVAVPLLVSLVVRSRARLWLHAGLYGLVVGTAFATLYWRVDPNYFAYFIGRLTPDDFYERQIRRENVLMVTPGVDDVRAIAAATRGARIVSLDVILHAHPDMLNVMLLYLPKADMQGQIDDPMSQDIDRRMVEMTRSNAYLQARFADIESRILADELVPPPVTRRGIWAFVSQYYDTHPFIQDTLIHRPERVVNLMAMHGARFLVTPPHYRDDAFRRVPGLGLLRESPNLDFFERESGARDR